MVGYLLFIIVEILNKKYMVESTKLVYGYYHNNIHIDPVSVCNGFEFCQDLIRQFKRKSTIESDLNYF